MDLQSQHFSKGLIDVVTRALYVSIYFRETLYEITKCIISCCFVLKIHWLLGIVYYIIYHPEEIESLIIAVECCILLGYIESVNFSQVSIRFYKFELTLPHLALLESGERCFHRKIENYSANEC